MAVVTDGRQDSGLATLLNSLARNGFTGTVWIGRRCAGPSFLENLPPSVSARLKVRVIELDTDRPLAYYKPDFIERVWQMAGPDAGSVTYMDCDLVLGCEWAFVHAWISSGLAIVEDLPGRLVGAQHPLRLAWHSFMEAVGRPPAREVSQYFNSGFVGVPRQCRDILPLWSEFGVMLEGLSVLQDPVRDTHMIVGVRSTARAIDVSPDVFALMRPYFQEDQDALNMAIMASDVPISPIGPDGMGFTATRMPIVPHAVGPNKPWAKAYLRTLFTRGQGPTFADDMWWAYSGYPIKVAAGWRYGVRRVSWRLAKIIARVL